MQAWQYNQAGIQTTAYRIFIVCVCGHRNLPTDCVKLQHNKFVCFAVDSPHTDNEDTVIQIRIQMWLVVLTRRKPLVPNEVRCLLKNSLQGEMTALAKFCNCTVTVTNTRDWPQRRLTTTQSDCTRSWKLQNVISTWMGDRHVLGFVPPTPPSAEILQSEILRRLYKSMVAKWMGHSYVPGFVPTLRFLQSEILRRLYKSPSDETINRGPPGVHACKKLTYAH